ncbi:class I SAM-dependent methyltransferase [bacterium]|nr:class I SAM-dependent methyltransferase [bacterium]
MSEKYVIPYGHKIYKKAAQREARAWGRSITVDRRVKRPRNHPLVVEYLSRKISGDENENDWLWWFTRDMETIDNALSLGSGIGMVEERLIRSGKIKKLDIVDLSSGAVEKFRGRLKEQGLEIPVSAQIGDLNFIELPENSYDFILANTILHHIINLEHLLEQVRRALKPGGKFLVFDFIGVNVWQWEPVTLEEVELALNLSRKRFPGLTFFPVKKPDPQKVRNFSPFESVRSAEIVEIIHQGFTPVHEVFTDRLLHVILNYGIEFGEWDNEELQKWISEMTLWEDKLSNGSEIPPNTLWGLYQTAPTEIKSPTMWDDKEIRERIAVNLIDPRGLVLDLIDKLPFRGPLVRLWMRLKRTFGWY